MDDQFKVDGYSGGGGVSFFQAKIYRLPAKVFLSKQAWDIQLSIGFKPYLWDNLTMLHLGNVMWQL